jgi:hypothetical protein
MSTALTLIDRECVSDDLGGEILAAHVDGLPEGSCRDDHRHRAVAPVEGRWGSGKSILVEKTVSVMPSQVKDDTQPVRPG